MRWAPVENGRVESLFAVMAGPATAPVKGPLYAGVDLGTANLVTVVVDGEGRPVAGISTHSRSTVRDGLVLDYVGAIRLLREQVAALRGRGLELGPAAAAYPPGTQGRDAEAFGHVLSAVGLEVAGLTDEPSAAALAMEIRQGCVVDIGGGTTGISVLEKGAVVYSDDEATGGHHLDLVIAGNFRIDESAAERIKTDPARQGEVAPLVRPVFQKMATIVRRHLAGRRVPALYLVGGTCAFPGAGQVAAETALATVLPSHPLLVTPLGIALHCLARATGRPPRPWRELA